MKVLLLLGLAVATNAAGPVTKKLGEVRRNKLAQAEYSLDTEVNSFNIPEACLVDADVDAPTVADCEELEPTLEFCECGDVVLPNLGSGHIVRQQASIAAAAQTAVASVPSVSAQCIGIERQCACAQTNQEARLTNEVRRHVEFEGAICVEEFAAYRAYANGTNSAGYTADKDQACVVNNQDNLSELEEDRCPEDLTFACESD